MRAFSLFLIFSYLCLTGVGRLSAQAPSPNATRPLAYPVRPAGAPEKIHHGQQLFAANCSFCHGSDARGGETGPNLVRSQLVLDDQNGEMIVPVVQNGRPAQGMPAFQLGASDIDDIVEYLHSLPLSSHNLPPSAPVDILVGDAEAGKAYFNGRGKCNSCHSVAGDMAGIGAKYRPRVLQNLIVSGGGGRHFGPATTPPPPPITATVTVASGKKYTGDLVYRSPFFAVITERSGTTRSFALDKPGISITVTNPLQAHLDLLAKWKDSDIHNVTRYLSTLK